MLALLWRKVHPACGLAQLSVVKLVMEMQTSVARLTQHNSPPRKGFAICLKVSLLMTESCLMVNGG